MVMAPLIDMQNVCENIKLLRFLLPLVKVYSDKSIETYEMKRIKNSEYDL